MAEIFCSDCGEKLSVDDRICPNCGSEKKTYYVLIEEKIETHEQIKGKAKENSVKKPFQEFKIGDDFHKKSGKWNIREMNIDRKNDSYSEMIKDGATGEIIHQCDEPLSKHKGHGSAKKK